MMKILTAQGVHDALIEEQLLTLEGQIKFNLGDVDIIVKQKDVVGNIMQEWLQGWFDKHEIAYLPNKNTQMPPDFYLNPQNETTDLLEVKAFNRNASPGFDIADFKMYSEEVIEKPYMLDVDYLIFGYDMSDQGIVTIKDLWIKKVWEITRRMENWPLNLQVKNNVVHKIRPGTWYSTGKQKFKMFSCLEHFLSALEETVYKNPKTHNDAASWKDTFLKSYKRFYDKKIFIPRWQDIENDYVDNSQ